MGMIMFVLFLFPSYTSAQSPFNLGEWWNNTQGNHAYAKKNYPSALRNYEQNTRKDSQNTKTHYNLGNTLQQTGQGEEGLKEWQHTLSESKDKLLRSQVYFNQSVVEIKAQNFSEAKQNLIQCLVNNPQDNDAKQNLEWVLMQLRIKKTPHKEPSRNKESPIPKENDTKPDSSGRSPVDQRPGARYSQKDAQKILDNFRNNNTLRPQKPSQEEQNDRAW